jgi:hypothetical protein
VRLLAATQVRFLLPRVNSLHVPLFLRPLLTMVLVVGGAGEGEAGAEGGVEGSDSAGRVACQEGEETG